MKIKPANRLKELRLENNLTIDELSNKVGIPKISLVKYENGVIFLRVSDLIKLAHYFDCRIDYLLCICELKR